MDTSSPAWLPLFALLALELALVVALAQSVQPALKNFFARRTLWQVALTSLALLAMVEVTGVGRSAWWRTAPLRDIKNDARTSVPLMDPGMPHPSLIERTEIIATPVTFRVGPVEVVEHPVWWPGILWLAGVVLFMGRLTAARLLFAWVQRRRQSTVSDLLLLERVRALAGRMGLRRTLRVTYTNGLAGPIAFGFFRPCISLPVAFQEKYSPTQQEAMLAHELAHLATHDPAWQLLADLVTALLWWHPLAWWSRRQLRSACEAAADEASLLIEDGPHALAECLVTLGGRMVRPHSFGGLGIEGDTYRSGLGQRVKRLLNMKGQCWRPRRWILSWSLTLSGPMILVIGMLAATSWVQPLEAKAETSGFQKSVIGLAWSTLLQVGATNPERSVAALGSIESEKIDWQPWSEAAVTEARAQGHPVLVYFTTDWSVSALANERANLNIPAVREKLRVIGAVTLRADNTKPNEAITAQMRAFDRGEVPLTLIYSPDTSMAAQALPAILTPELVLQALEQSMQTPPRSVDATKGARSRKNDVSTLILQGKELLDAGKKAAAKTKLEEALKLDPGNKAAAHYLSLAETEHGTATVPNYVGVTILGDLPAIENPLPTNAAGQGASVPARETTAITSLPVSPTEALHTRWFKVDPAVLNTNLRDLLGTNAVSSKSTGMKELALPNLRRLLGASGVELSDPKHLFLNDRSGMLMVRATLAELAAVEQLIQMLSTSPAQVVLEIRFCEVIEEDREKLGFDWFLGNPVGTNAFAPLENPLTPWPVPGTTTWENRRPDVEEPAAATITGILTDTQFAGVLRALERRRGINLMTAPRVTTLSGRQAQIKTVEVRYIVTDLDFNTNAAPAANGITIERLSRNGDNADSVGIQPIAKPFELGPVIDVVPTVAADGFSIHLSVIATIKEFLRYENKEGFVATLRSGKSDALTAPTPLPTFRLRQIVTSAVVWDGQTLVLSGGSMVSEGSAAKADAGGTGQKGATRLLRSNTATRQTKSLLLFVTPTIIDPAGNRVHSPEELSIRRNAIPPQKVGKGNR